MGKIIGLLLVVVGIWVGVEVYSNGVDGAFGGVLASRAGDRPAAEVDRRSTPRRAGDAVENAHAAADARREKLLGE